MKQRLCLALPIFLSAAWFSAGASAATVDFEAVPRGTVYGDSVGQVAGDFAFAQDGIDVFVESFQTPGFTGFFDAQVGGAFADSFPTQAVQLDNISFRFDFTNLPLAQVNQVTFEFMHFGGMDNFAVNGATPLILGSLANIPSMVAANVTASVNNGVVTLTGPVDSILIGGQELAIDNITAVPEPATLMLLCIGGAAVLRHRLRRTLSRQ